MSCHRCGKPCTNPQPSTETQSIPYRQNGWVGDKFIDYDKKFKGVKTTRVNLCGLCYAIEEVYDQIALGEDMNELHQALLAMAQNEVDGRSNTPSTSKAGRTSKVSRRRKSSKPKMSREESNNFDGYSEANTVHINEARSCE